MSQARQSTETAAAQPSLTRRGFMATAGAAAVSFAVMEPGVVRGSAANSKINLGLIGCGGRGTWIAKLFQQHGGYNLVAVADYFQDRADSAGKQLGVPEANRFTGLNGYRKVLEKVEAVALETTPYFRPEQAAAALPDVLAERHHHTIPLNAQALVGKNDLVGIAPFHAGRDGGGSPVGDLDHVHVEVVVREHGTADRGDTDRAVLDAELLDRLRQQPMGNAMAAAGTIVRLVLKLVLPIKVRVERL